MTAADIADGLRLCRFSQWDQVARDWERFLAPRDAGATAAVRDERVLGTSARIQYGDRFGWIGMVLVDPDAQGQGLGGSLLKYSLDALQHLPAIRLDATPAGYPLYLKQGFAEESRSPIHGAGGEVERMTRRDLPDIARMDLPAFGAPRIELLGWMLEGAPEYAWIARHEGQVAGYLFGRHGFEFAHLGPIVASDSAIAVQLTAACLAQDLNRPIIIDATYLDRRWMHFLEEAGFREQRPFIRMHRGSRLPFGEPHHQFAVLGPEFG
jgi:GNAT superfamily N-acetyltransferase